MDEALLMKVRDSELSDVRLAEELGVSRYAVRQARISLGLGPRGQAGRPKVPLTKRAAHAQLERAVRALAEVTPETRVAALEAIAEAAVVYVQAHAQAPVHAETQLSVEESNNG